MKIVLLSKGRSHHNYFINNIHIKYGIELSVVEDMNTTGVIFKKIKKHGLYNSLRYAITKYITKMSKLNKKCSEINTFRCSDINHQSVIEKIKSIDPDLIIVHGTSILLKQTLSNFNNVINVHWGLSPYYRGTHCTEWALLNRDYLNIGVTIHYISNNIDGGDIIAQRRYQINSFPSNIENIDFELTKLGLEEIIKIIDAYRDHRKLILHKQKLDEGFLYLSSQWTSLLEKHLKGISKRIRNQHILLKPSRKALPIIEFKVE